MYPIRHSTNFNNTNIQLYFVLVNRTRTVRIASATRLDVVNRSVKAKSATPSVNTPKSFQ